LRLSALDGLGDGPAEVAAEAVVGGFFDEDGDKDVVGVAFGIAVVVVEEFRAEVVLEFVGSLQALDAFGEVG
jgi:hypothetical protein